MLSKLYGERVFEMFLKKFDIRDAIQKFSWLLLSFFQFYIGKQIYIQVELKKPE